MCTLIPNVLNGTRGGGGVNYHQTYLFAAISEPLGVKGNALVTFPKYVLTIEWHNFCNYIPTRRSKMAAAKTGGKYVSIHNIIIIISSNPSQVL